MTCYDRTEEDIVNIVALEHVNVRVPDQQLAVTFYIMGLGLTRDPFLMTGTNNMWVNVGRSQFHLPTHEKAQVLRGHTGLVIPDRAALLERLHNVEAALADTQFAVTERNEFVEVACPWGNKIRVFEPDERFGAMRLGMPYVRVDVPPNVTDRVVRFYNEILDTHAEAHEDEGAPCARVAAGDGQVLIFRETDTELPEFDGHHIAIYLANFSTPYRKLLELSLISEESDQHQYRFVDIVDLDTGEPLVRLEHEVRSMRHPMYARPLANRDPSITNRNYAPGWEQMKWAQAPGS